MINCDFAIVGGGLAGSILALELINNRVVHPDNLTIIDSAKIKESYTSSFGTPPIGIVHPFPGRSMKVNKIRFDAVEYFKLWANNLARYIEIEDIIFPVLSVRPVEDVNESKLLDSFKNNSENYPEFIVASRTEVAGIYRDSIVYNYSYIVKAKLLCEKIILKLKNLGVNFLGQDVLKLNLEDDSWVLEFESLDSIKTNKLFICTGARINEFLKFDEYSFTAGELMFSRILEDNLPRRSIENKIFIKNGHLLFLPDGTALTGSTYRHPDKDGYIKSFGEDQVTDYLLKKQAKIIKKEVSQKVVSIWSGRRTTLQTSKLPVVGKTLYPNLYISCGYGSKGLLYIPWLSNLLVKESFANEGLSNMTSFAPKNYSINV